MSLAHVNHVLQDSPSSFWYLGFLGLQRKGCLAALAGSWRNRETAELAQRNPKRNWKTGNKAIIKVAVDNLLQIVFWISYYFS